VGGNPNSFPIIFSGGLKRAFWGLGAKDPLLGDNIFLGVGQVFKITPFMKVSGDIGPKSKGDFGLGLFPPLKGV